MDEAIKAQWTAALRSGDYPQGKNRLRSKEGFCCLGVLCDLAVKAGVVKVDHRKYHPGLPDSPEYWLFGDKLEEATLPREVRDWAGLPRNPDVEFAGREQPIAGVNDEGVRFATIADLIDQQL